MKQFIVTKIVTEPDGQVILYGPSGSLRVRRHESNDPGHEHSYSHALISKSAIFVAEETSHSITIPELEVGKGTAF